MAETSPSMTMGQPSDPRKNNSAADSARAVVARGFPGKAGLANRKFTLEPRLLDLIGGLLLSPAIPTPGFAVRLGKGSFAHALFARMLLRL